MELHLIKLINLSYNIITTMRNHMKSKQSNEDIGSWPSLHLQVSAAGPRMIRYENLTYIPLSFFEGNGSRTENSKCCAFT